MYEEIYSKINLTVFFSSLIFLFSKELYLLHLILLKKKKNLRYLDSSIIFKWFSEFTLHPFLFGYNACMSNVILKCQVRVKNDLKFRNTHVKNSIKMLASSSPFETKSCGLLTLIITIQQKSVPYVQINNGMALKIINVC